MACVVSVSLMVIAIEIIYVYVDGLYIGKYMLLLLFIHYFFGANVISRMYTERQSVYSLYG